MICALVEGIVWENLWFVFYWLIKSISWSLVDVSSWARLEGLCARVSCLHVLCALEKACIPLCISFVLGMRLFKCVCNVCVQMCKYVCTDWESRWTCWCGVLIKYLWGNVRWIERNILHRLFIFFLTRVRVRDRWRWRLCFKTGLLLSSIIFSLWMETYSISDKLQENIHFQFPQLGVAVFCCWRWCVCVHACVPCGFRKHHALLKKPEGHLSVFYSNLFLIFSDIVFRSNSKGIVFLKWKFFFHLDFFVSFKTCMTLFILHNTKEVFY